MRTVAVRFITLFFVAVFALSCLITGTLCWQSVSHQAKNETQSKPVRQVELLKLEKQPDGTETEQPIPNTTFYLFKENDTQVGDRYVTDENGKISVKLAPGDYYFEESAPASGFTFDTDEQGRPVTRYPFTVTGTETVTIQLKAYNTPLQGALVVQKLVENSDNTPLTDAQKQQEFAFTVNFSDGGTYSYSIDGGEPQQITSGGTLVLKHGQSAVFETLPVGITYTVTEQSVPGYVVSSIGHTGTITELGSTAQFVNTYVPDKTGSLTVSKEVQGDGADLNKEFTFTAVIGGKTETFVLKHGESKVFPNLPIGIQYTITEADYTSDGYTALTKSYSGIIQSEDSVELPFVNIYSTPQNYGSLRVKKEVVGENADPRLTFTFTVEFSDGQGYPYRINGGELIEMTGPVIILHLKDAQTALFEGIPEGITYTVKETDPSGYLQDLNESSGTIVGDSAYVIFRNHVPKPEKPAKLRVTKKLAGEYPQSDKNKEFRFTLTIDGEEQAFILKPGETKEFEIPAGAQYEVCEDNPFDDGYALTIENGSGTALPEKTIDVTATNTFVGAVQTKITGEKTWELGNNNVTLPKSILIRLKDGERVVEEATVTPDDNGKWKYTFSAPKYNVDGEEIHYTVEEASIVGFVPSYNGFDILNTYIPPIEIAPPIIEKVVEGENAPETEFVFLLRGDNGAPMPKGSNGSIKVVTRLGSGQVKLGVLSYDSPGVYIYTVSELSTDVHGWQYDNTMYTLTVTVTLKDGALHAKQELTKSGKSADKALFINRYTPDESDIVEIDGRKTWNHGDNPNHPDSIIVYVYADGELAVQKLVTADDNWSYSFEMPKYAQDGHKIAYTVGEADVPGYTAEIKGYDIVNTYNRTTPTTPSGDESSKPSNSGSTKTGDTRNPGLWFAIMLLSLAVLIVTIRLGRREKGRK